MLHNYIRVAGIIIQNGKLLMVKGKGYNELWTPGGKPKIDESDEDCLRRELQEEIGVTLLTFKHFGDYTSQSPYEANRLSTNKMYLCTISGEPKPNNEIAEVIWLNHNNFLNNTYVILAMDKNQILPDIIKAKLF